MSPTYSSPGLSVMPDEVLEVLFSKLAPPDVSTLLTVFSGSGTPRLKPLAARLMQSSLRRHLDEALKSVNTVVRDPYLELVHGNKAVVPPNFTIDDIFPEEDVRIGRRFEKSKKRKKDGKGAPTTCNGGGKPQILLSGSLAVQAALGRVFKKSCADIDIFCT